MLRLLSQRFNFSLFKDLTKSFISIQNTSKNIKKALILKQYMQSLKKAQVITLQNILNLYYTKFSRLNDKLLLKYSSSSLQIDSTQLQQYLKQKNDLQEAIAKLHKGGKINKKLTLEDVYQKFVQIKNTAGEKIFQNKFSIVNYLLSSCQDQNQRKLILSLITGKLQIGMHQKTINVVFKQCQVQIIYNDHKYRCMLSKSLSNFDDLIKFVDKQPFATEIKFDGERTHIQYQKQNGLVQMFSRRSKEQQVNFPDIPQLIKNQLQSIPQLNTCILDGQIICVDASGNPMQIRILLNSKSKTIQQMDSKYFYKIKVFDILELNGKPLLDIPYSQRIKLIPKFDNKQILNPIDRKFFQFPQQLNSFKQYFKNIIKLNYEGVIVKKMNSTYNIIQSKKDWAKLKRGQNEQGLIGRAVDIDLIIMGAYKGRGKRIGKYGSLLVGVHHEGKIYPISKVGSSLSEQMYDTFNSQITKNISKQVPQPYFISKKINKPDVWIKPGLVVQIFSQEWSRSPIYDFNQNNQGGLSLRFPIIIRLRDDKGIQESTQGHELLNL